MKAPNIVSVLGMIVVILPAFIRAIAEQWPPDVYWQAALATGIVAAIIKGIEVYMSRPQLPPGVSAAEYKGPSMAKRWLVG